jgi:uncharacterized protein (TIGR02680 family)
MTAPLTLPPLPEPQTSRWQPLRIGLVELYHYDCEEFWFRDGHLLLRGNNGTGKSKVLSLTLPFLLDGQLNPARVEPDGDRGKRMEWNLLLGGRYERRTGYAWIEFGRRSDENEASYCTLGCGMSALAGRPRVESWHFITEQRIGRELWLVTPDRVVVGRERLAERLGTSGQIFDTAQEYRRAVDERLFRLGEDRYRALMDTLITLRQPQLSKRPDEQNLSNALTEALSPIPQATLEDVAEAMTQLDEYRDALAAQEQLRDAVAQFGRRYRVYAGVKARRVARVLRQAQTEFDNTSRALNDARAEHDAALEAVAREKERLAAVERQLAGNRAALDELRQGPVAQDARRLHSAQQASEERKRDLQEARLRCEEAERRETGERGELERRGAAVQRSLAALERQAEAAAQTAATLGLGAEHARLGASLQPFAALAERTATELERVHGQLRSALERRREHFRQVRRRFGELGEAAHARDLASAARGERAEMLESAETQSRNAGAALEGTLGRFVHDWKEYIDGLSVLRLADREGAYELLGAWAESLSGRNPLLDMLTRAQQEAALRLAERDGALAREEGDASALQRDLMVERERLAKGEELLPPTPYARAEDARRDRHGAPLWRLVEFAPALSEPARAGLEAALEAAGLLDAWVTSAGDVLDPRTHDVVLVERAARSSSLLECLVPAEGAAVEATHVASILAAISCSDEDAGDAEAWVSCDGRFRLGPARGAWEKPLAQYIGAAARERERRRRLLEIAAALDALQTQLERLVSQRAALAREQGIFQQEYARVPADDDLRAAHAHVSAAEAQRRGAQTRLEQAEARLNEAEERWREARERLERDAADLGVPADEDAFASLEPRLEDYARVTLSLMQAAREHRQALAEVAAQRERVEQARVQAQAALEDSARRDSAAREALARYQTLQSTVGAAVAELERRMAETAAAVRSGQDNLEEANRKLVTASEERARSAQKLEDLQQALDERQERRQGAIEGLRAFAQTGLLSVAVPELDFPDPAGTWSIDPALNAARRAEQALASVAAEDTDWTRIQNEVSRDFTALTQAMSAQGHQAQGEPSDHGFIVQIVYQNRPERPDVMEKLLESEIRERRQILTAREREVLENHLQAEVAAALQRLLQEAERRVQTINAELGRRSTSTGVRFKLEWQPLPEGEEGAPAGLKEARTRLLNTAADAWSPADRALVGEFLHNRIAGERVRDDGGSLLEHLSRALDYRRWHRFRVKRFQDGAWRPLSGPASSGERALGLTVPLFAAASSHYASAEHPHAPRLVLLDEAFAGIDDEARAHCMALIREFDLDFVMTSEREWGCYAELPGLSICNLVRREGVDAVFVSRWSWDGRARRVEADPSRRYPESAALVP